MNETEWVSIAKEWPPKDTTFALAWDGYWIRAHRGNKELIIAEWIGEKFTWDLNELGSTYWLYIPNPPQ